MNTVPIVFLFGIFTFIFFLNIILSPAWFCALLFIAVSLPVIAASLPVIATKEAIQAQATTWIASFLAMTGTKISSVKYKLQPVYLLGVAFSGKDAGCRMEELKRT
jgi:hypothetical protein